MPEKVLDLLPAQAGDTGPHGAGQGGLCPAGSPDPQPGPQADPWPVTRSNEAPRPGVAITTAYLALSIQECRLRSTGNQVPSTILKASRLTF